MYRTPLCLIACFGMLLGLASTAQAVTFKEIARFDVSAASADPVEPGFIGNNPSAVAWNGSQLYVAGFNSSGVANQTAIVEITNASASGINTATFGTPFGTLSTPNLRGYSGLDLDLGVLAASYDAGASSPSGIQAYDPSTNAAISGYPLEGRGGSGVAIDPGFGGSPAAVAWGTFGSGRIRLNDATDGSVIVDGTDGLVYFANNSTFLRDTDFDVNTGDLYVRVANDVIGATRTSGTEVAGATVLVDLTDAPFVAGQNLEFLETDQFGGALIYNDRATTGSSPFASSVQLADPTGAALSAAFALLDGGTPADGAGYYDFDFDPASQTLALMDFANRNVHIFQVVPEPTALVLMGIGLVAMTAKRRS